MARRSAVAADGPRGRQPHLTDTLRHGPPGDPRRLRHAVACARRLRSNTPLAALAGLNEPVFVEAARALALRTLEEGGRDDASRGHYAFLLCTCRPPTDDELKELLAFIAAQRKRLAEGWTNAREVATGDGEKPPGLPEGVTPQDAAVWTLAARVLLNLDETLTKN